MINHIVVRALFRLGEHPKAIKSITLAKYMKVTNQEAQTLLKELNTALYGDK